MECYNLGGNVTAAHVIRLPGHAWAFRISVFASHLAIGGQVAVAHSKQPYKGTGDLNSGPQTLPPGASPPGLHLGFLRLILPLKLQLLRLDCPANPTHLCFQCWVQPCMAVLSASVWVLEIGTCVLGLDSLPRAPHQWSPASRLPLVSPMLTSWLPIQVMLVVKYWTLLFVGSVVLSLSSYVIMTSITQSLWMYKISPKTFPFLCELPLASSGGRELSG